MPTGTAMQNTQANRISAGSSHGDVPEFEAAARRDPKSALDARRLPAPPAWLAALSPELFFSGLASFTPLNSSERASAVFCGARPFSREGAGRAPRPDGQETAPAREAGAVAVAVAVTVAVEVGGG